MVIRQKNENLPAETRGEGVSADWEGAHSCT